MSRITTKYESDGFFGIGILHTSDSHNIGTLWRTAYILGASFIFTIDKKYQKQSSDITRTWSKIPLFHYKSFADFLANIPHSTKIVAIELTDTAQDLKDYQHPTRAVYLLGAEGTGIPEAYLSQVHDVVKLPGSFSLNVAVTGSIVVHDRITKIPTRLPGKP